MIRGRHARRHTTRPIASKASHSPSIEVPSKHRSRRDQRARIESLLSANPSMEISTETGMTMQRSRAEPTTHPGRRRFRGGGGSRSDDGTVSISTDCNSMRGSYEVTGHSIAFGLMAATRMYCEGSQEADFARTSGRDSPARADPRHPGLPRPAVEGAARLAARARLHRSFRKGVLRRLTERARGVVLAGRAALVCPASGGRRGPISASW